MTALHPTTTTVTGRLQSLHSFLEETNDRLKAGQVAGAKVWPSGFGALDKALTGGFRSGELVLLGGPQGLGKTTFGLQVMRNLIAANHSAVYFSFEHDNHTLLERLIAMEAAEIAGPTAVPLHRVRQAFEARHSSEQTLEGRLEGTLGGVEAVQAAARRFEKMADRLALGHCGQVKAGAWSRRRGAAAVGPPHIRRRRGVRIRWPGARSALDRRSAR